MAGRHRGLDLLRGMARLALAVTTALAPLVPSPALAKCCELDHVVVTGPGLEGGTTISADELAGKLSDGDMTLLYWPVFNSPFKGDERPEGDLGPAYDVTYVLPAARGDATVSARETLYPFADPPVAFAHKGQRHDLYGAGESARRVPWGWRPFPAAAVVALFDGLDHLLPPQAQEALGRLPAGSPPQRSSSVPALALGAAVLAALLLLGFRAAKNAAPSPTV